MPQFSSTPNLEVFYSSDASGSNEYGYNTLSMVSGIPDVSQLQIIWKVAIVLNSSGNPVAVSSFTDAEQEILQTLSASMYDVDADSKTVTLIPSAIAGGEVTLNGAVYTYDSPFAGVSSADPLYIRRSTDVTSRAVIFQPGSRLTEELLNTSSAQVFNAMQELTAFGSGGGGAVGSIDLEDNSINDLGDVNLTTDGILYWNGSDVTSDGSSGGLVPDPNSAQDGMVLTRTSPGSSLFDWEFTSWDKVFSSTGVALDAQISNMSGSIQANTSRSVANETTLAYSAYATIGPDAYKNADGTSAVIEVTSSGSPEDVNLFRNSTGKTFSNMDNPAAFTLVGDTSAPGYAASQPFECLDSNSEAFLTIETSNVTENVTFNKSGLYRVDLSGIFLSVKDPDNPTDPNPVKANGGFRIKYNGAGAPFTQNPISNLPNVNEGSEFISCSFMIPVSEADVDVSTFGFLVTSNAPTSGTSFMTCSRIQFSVHRISDI